MTTAHDPSARSYLLCGCLLLATACNAQSFELVRESVPVTASGSRMSHDPPSGTAGRMAHHFADVLEIQQAVIAGELADVRPPAQRLVDQTDRYPESWRPFMAAHRRLAESALPAQRLADAAQAAAGLANNCGECHAAVGLRPELVVTAWSTDALDASPPMLRHPWAVERMGDGLVAHDDAVWRAGARALADAPLLPSVLSMEVNRPAAFDALASRVHDLGAQAPTIDAWSDRAALYGELLTTCVACHRGLVSGRSSYLARWPDRAEGE